MPLILEDQTLNRRTLIGRPIKTVLLGIVLCLSSQTFPSDDGPQDENLGQENLDIARRMEEESLKKAKNIDLKDVVDTPLEVQGQAVTTSQAGLSEKTAEGSSSKLAEGSSSKLAEGSSSKAAEGSSPKRADDSSHGQTEGSSPAGEASFSFDAQEEVEAQLAATPKPKVKRPTKTAKTTSDSSILKKLAKELVGEPSDVSNEPLILLNSEVPPGTSARLSWSPNVGFMGISAPTAVLVVNGEKPGPTLCLTAAVHGDELNGIEIVRRVLYNVEPKQLSGALIGVPIVNLQGFRSSSRYLSDRRDLNRFFPGNPRGSSASRIAHSFFEEVVKHCDMLIDLHTGSFRRTNLPQLRADLGYEEVASLAEKMGAIVVVQSKGAAGSLRRAAVENGIPSVTLEAGAPHELQKTSVEHGVKSVESAMDGLGMVNRRRFWERPDEPVYYQSTWVRAREGGILFSEVDLGASVKKGDLLGVVTDPITNQSTKIKAPLDGRIIGMALNQVMFPGFAAYHIGLKASVEEAAQNEPVIVNDTTSLPNGEANIKIDADSSADEDIDGENIEASEAKETTPAENATQEESDADVVNAEDSE